jgi:hypothetical protein
LPLAIEFAASRVEVLGVEGLAVCLDDSLPLVERMTPYGNAAAPNDASPHRSCIPAIRLSFGARKNRLQSDGCIAS